MIKVKRQSTVTYTPKQMYDLVNDVDKYKEFVPYCTDSSVISRQEDHMIASLTFSLGPLQQTFTTRNTLTPNRRVELSLVSGPFKSLKGYWAFIPLGDETSIEMDIEFEIVLSAAGWMIKPILHSTIDKLVDTFVNRANVIYGK